jgi:hypothetical protein
LATPNYDINYDDKRFTQVNNEKNAALSEMEKTYGGMINDSDKYFQEQISATEKWGAEQKKNQQAQTDFAIEKIEQQKDQAQKDYIKEQSGAYTDWQKQSDPYGVDAEQKAAAGMANSGYSESSKVAMFTTYQNRVIAAREVYSRAVLNYDNAIKDATLQNNAALAEIAYNTLQKSLELGLQGFQYKNQLIIEKANKKTELKQIYHSRYQDVLNQINKENALKEEVRQYNEKMAEEKRQYNTTLKNQREQFNQQQDLARRELKLKQDQFAWQKAEAAKSSSSGGSRGGSSIRKSSSKKSSGSSVKKSSSTRSGGGGTFGSSSTSGKDYLNALIRSGASKDKVSNEIALALRNGAITKKEAAALRATFTPRGVQY